MGKKERLPRSLATLNAVLRALPPVIKRLQESGTTEIDVGVGDARVYIKRAVIPGVEVVNPQPAETEERNLYEDKTRFYHLKSPLSAPGVFYRRPKPEAEPFVEEGGFVEVEQPLCILEAYKIMNEITAERAGQVVKIVAENGELVEAGGTLMVIDTSQPPPTPPGPYA